MNKKLIISSCIGLIIFSSIAILLYFNRLSGFDSFIYNIIISCKSEYSTYYFKCFTYIGSTVGMIIVMALLLLFCKNKINVLHIIFCSSISQIVNHIVKIIFTRERPTLINMLDLKSYSFPSGHAMCNFVLYGFLIYYIYKNNFKYKYLISVLLIILILTIGVSRIYLGVHFASDVIGGFGLGLLVLCLYIYIVLTKRKKKV